MFCPKCGKQLNDGDTFCAFCGETLNNGGNTNQVFQTPPVSYNAQQYQAPSSVPENAIQPKRSNTALISAVTMAICFVLIGSFILFIKPGYLLKRDDYDSSNTTTNTTTSAAASEIKPAVSSEEPKEQPTEITTVAETTAVTTTPTTTSAHETTTTVQKTTVTTDDNGLEEKNAVYAEAMSLSTDERPTFEELNGASGRVGLCTRLPQVLK